MCAAPFLPGPFHTHFPAVACQIPPPSPLVAIVMPWTFSFKSSERNPPLLLRAANAGRRADHRVGFPRLKKTEGAIEIYEG